MKFAAMQILHLDDAWSYEYDDDNEMLIKVYVDSSASPPPVSIPSAIRLLGSAFIGLWDSAGSSEK